MVNIDGVNLSVEAVEKPVVKRAKGDCANCKDYFTLLGNSDESIYAMFQRSCVKNGKRCIVSMIDDGIIAYKDGKYEVIS